MRVPAVLLLLLTLLLPARADAQWGAREAAPAGTGDAGPAFELPGGSWVTLADMRAGSNRKVAWLQRDAGATFTARDLPGGYGGGTSAFAPDITLSAPDDAGTTFAFKSQSPHGTLRFPLGADPSAPVLQPTPAIVGALDLAPSGEAVALIDGGNDLGVIFRPAGPDAAWDQKRTLNRGGADRAYPIGITLDPDGGVFVVYETQQPAAVLSVYAPPDGDFGTPVTIPAGDADDVSYAQSTNGHVVVTWQNAPGTTTNRQRVFAATRAPGGALGPAAELLDRTGRGQFYTAGAQSAGITDDGATYVGIFEGPTTNGCSGNADLGRTALLARGRAGSADWAVEPVGGGAWPDRAEVPRISTSGNRVGIVRMTTTDTGSQCAQGTPATLRFEVALGTGGTLGAFTTLYERTEESGGYTSVQSLGVGAAGSALLLLKENRPVEQLYAYPYAGTSAPAPPTPGPPTPGTPAPGAPSGTPQPPAAPRPPLPPPGGVTFGRGFTVVGKDGTVTFKAGCAAESRDGIDVCKVRAGFREAVKTTRPRALAAAARSLGSTRTTIRAGKRKTIRVKLNKRGRKLAKRRKGVAVRLTVTITRGEAVRTVTKRATLKTRRR